MDILEFNSLSPLFYIKQQKFVTLMGKKNNE